MSNDNKKCIIIFTNTYPYGKGEEFFETELEYIRANFDRTIIISTCRSNVLTRKVPDNVVAYRYPVKSDMAGELGNVCSFFSRDFREEIVYIKKYYGQKVKFKHVKSIFQMMYYGSKLEKYLSKIISEQKITGKLFLYSYWCMNSAYAVSCYKAKNHGTIAISRAHGYDLYFERSSSYLPFRGKIADRLDRIFFISENGKRYFQDRVKLYDDTKLVVSRLGIANDLYTDKESPGNDHTLNIVSCSYMIPEKRVNLIVKALSEIDDFKLSWTHIGDGPLFDTVLKEAASYLDGKSNISCRFLGHLDNRQVYEYYKDNKVDAFINVSSSEGIPVSIMEACSFGIPIIATDVGGVNEIVNTSNGILLSENPDTAEIVNAIKFIRLSGRDEVDKLRKGSYKMWSENYDARKNYSDFIKEIISITPDNK